MPVVEVEEKPIETLELVATFLLLLLLRFYVFTHFQKLYIQFDASSTFAFVPVARRFYKIYQQNSQCIAIYNTYTAEIKNFLPDDVGLLVYYGHI